MIWVIAESLKGTGTNYFHFKMMPLLCVVFLASSPGALTATVQHRSEMPMTMKPFIPLENLTAYWSYYNKYLRRPIADLIDKIPLTIQAQQDSSMKSLTPKDIRKSISEALDMMPFSNKTAFELEIERLREEGKGNTSPSQGLWMLATPKTSMMPDPRVYIDFGSSSTGNDIKLVGSGNSKSEPPRESDSDQTSEPYPSRVGQPPTSHHGRPSISVVQESSQDSATTMAHIPASPAENNFLREPDQNASQALPYVGIVLPGSQSMPNDLAPVKPHTASYYSYGLPPFQPSKDYHPHFHFPTKVSHKVVPVPFPVVRVQPVYYPIYKQVQVPRPYPIVHERHVPVPHYIPVPKPVPQLVYIPMPKPIPQPVPVPEPVPVPKPVPYAVPKPYPVPVPLPPKEKSVIQLGLRIERPQSPPLRQRVFQFLIPAVSAAVSPTPPPPQAIPVPVPGPPMGSSHPAYGHFGGPAMGKGGFPVTPPLGDFGGGGFNPGGYGGGFESSLVPSVSGGGGGSMATVPGIRDIPGGGGAVEVNRRSATSREEVDGGENGGGRLQPFQQSQTPEDGEQKEPTSMEAKQQPHKSSLMRFIFNVDN